MSGYAKTRRAPTIEYVKRPPSSKSCLTHDTWAIRRKVKLKNLSHTNCNSCNALARLTTYSSMLTTQMNLRRNSVSEEVWQFPALRSDKRIHVCTFSMHTFSRSACTSLFASFVNGFSKARCSDFGENFEPRAHIE